MTPNRMILAALLLAAAGCATAGPRTVAPRYINREYFESLIEREYPPLLLYAGIGGETEVFLKLDSEGIVEDVSVRESSGYPELDALALRASREIRFAPALVDGKPVPVGISFTVTFEAR